MSTCLTLGVTFLSSTIEIKLVLYYQYTVGSTLWSAKGSMYLQIAFVLLKVLYMYLIHPPVNSEDIAG